MYGKSPYTIGYNSCLTPRQVPFCLFFHLLLFWFTFVHIDEVKIQRLISNLARNAGQAMTTGGTFELISEQEGEYLCLTFRDTEPGIPADIQAHIFESFVTSRSSEGSGLGLAIVKKIVEDHTGTIEFTSIPNVGTTFVVKLPLQGPSHHVTPELF